MCFLAYWPGEGDIDMKYSGMDSLAAMLVAVMTLGPLFAGVLTAEKPHIQNKSTIQAPPDNTTRPQN